MISKLLWYLERSRRCPPPPHIPRRFATGNEATLAVLTTPKCTGDALWSLWSWSRALEGRISPRLFVDGVLTPEQRALFGRYFPDMPVDELRPWLAARRDLGPNVRKLIASFKMGGKSALVACLGADGPAIYSDSDVLAFRPPTQLMEGLATRTAQYLLDGDASNYDRVVKANAIARGLPLPPTVNSGVLTLPHGVVTPATLEHSLTGFTEWESLNESWFSEQTLTALLMGQVTSQPLPALEYVVSLQRQFFFEHDVDYTRTVVRHFTGPVRHVMYLKGIPFLKQLPERP